MFGMSFTEILIIAVIAILFLGPEKLPDAMVKIAKFFKSFKNSVNEAKLSLEQEMKVQELKEEAKEYRAKLDNTKSTLQKSINIDAFEEATSTIKDVKEGIQEVKDSTNLSKQIEKFASANNEPKEPKQKEDS